MRQLDPVTNLILAALAGLGLLATMSMPWFAPVASSPTETDGPVEKAAWQVAHFFGTNVPGTTSGKDAVESTGMSILVLVVAAVAVLAALVLLVPAVRKPAEDILQVAAFAPPVAVVLLAFSHSGTQAPVNIHYGVLVSFLVATFMASCAWCGASMRSRRKQAPRAIRVSNS